MSKRSCHLPITLHQVITQVCGAVCPVRIRMKCVNFLLVERCMVRRERQLLEYIPVYKGRCLQESCIDDTCFYLFLNTCICICISLLSFISSLINKSQFPLCHSFSIDNANLVHVLDSEVFLLLFASQAGCCIVLCCDDQFDKQIGFFLFYKELCYIVPGDQLLLTITITFNKVKI